MLEKKQKILVEINKNRENMLFFLFINIQEIYNCVQVKLINRNDFKNRNALH